MNVAVSDHDASKRHFERVRREIVRYVTLVAISERSPDFSKHLQRMAEAIRIWNGI